MIAVIKTGGKQYKVKEGQSVKVEKLDGDKGKKIKIDTLLIADSESGEIKSLGTPSLGEKVSAEIIETGKDKKVTVVKYKNKTRYKRTIGHRQPYTKIKIEKIG
ncbi:50S ribosomal protein L21 [Candidatus Falkowbacteria bacterium CG10_big_fil_rev_8_21_14_0_10_37_6]|uniref:Large ribosomal subunit protein bL21 n=1 Tax=Candidatus Falkowbacteria bacterium CG10_big_fil_rev_8_21_14_0_10_37_6 TaxID=1974563 RepID=A0A2H0V6W2_9BACT|nr:MAG: 50S ribosomal protein L21 [Candidatus Falkowbacteria bacterium CG10_big_fil_rev_8_21_14_0_10_37_6]